MIEKFIKKMVKEKLDFLPLEESMELLKSGVQYETKFGWVGCSEELEDNGDNMTLDEIINSHEFLYGSNNDQIRVGKSDEFSEFTLFFCPAPTYGDLLKLI